MGGIQEKVNKKNLLYASKTKSCQFICQNKSHYLRHNAEQVGITYLMSKDILNHIF